MHYNIRILSTGADKEEARANAFAYATQLVDRGNYDYYTVEGSRTYRLASKLGQEAVQGALAANRRAFDEALQIVKLMLEQFTDEQIYQEDYGEEPLEYYASRWQFGQVDGKHFYLYGTGDFWGEAIRNDKDYQAATEGRDDLWITNVDLHS